jgi:hypothetical protein
MGFKESKHFDFFLKIPLIIFVAFISHKTYPITNWIIAIMNEMVFPTTKFKPKKLNKEKKHNLRQITNKICHVTP